MAGPEEQRRLSGLAKDCIVGLIARNKGVRHTLLINDPKPS